MGSCQSDESEDHYFRDPNEYVELYSKLYLHMNEFEIFKKLLECGADPNQMCRKGTQHYTLMWAFCFSNKWEHVKLMIKHGATVDPELIRVNRCPEFVPLLIQKGADINDQGLPIAHALYSYDEDLVEAVLKYRPKMNCKLILQLKTVFPRLYLKWIRCKWSLLKPCVKLLSLHARAVITANHPLRMLERGEFHVI